MRLKLKFTLLNNQMENDHLFAIIAYLIFYFYQFISLYSSILYFVYLFANCINFSRKIKLDVCILHARCNYNLYIFANTQVDLHNRYPFSLTQI